MVAKKKVTGTKKKIAKPKTKVVYKTRTVYRKAPKESNPMGDVVKNTAPLIGLGMGAMIGFGVAGAINHSLNGD